MARYPQAAGCAGNVSARQDGGATVHPISTVVSKPPTRSPEGAQRIPGFTTRRTPESVSLLPGDKPCARSQL